ncbi:uncharacterized protein [Eurosta solidaginis]|uniref:uncharacterized protein n=1 Tax=Eurosta solidaginis TaxID=178769 RepID=UPI003530B504
MHWPANKKLFAQLLLLGSGLLLITRTHTALALPIVKGSQVKKIIVPYQRHIVSGHPYQYPKLMSETRQVFVPIIMEMGPRFNLNQGALARGKLQGEKLNFADGAYPVYYMPSNVNGKFNGKFSLLEGVLKEQQSAM